MDCLVAPAKAVKKPVSIESGTYPGQKRTLLLFRHGFEALTRELHQVMVIVGPMLLLNTEH